MKKKPLLLINVPRIRQQGNFMIEAMVSMLLASMLIIGAMYMSSRSLVAQRDMRLQEIVIDQLRAVLVSNQSGGSDICSASPQVTLPDGETLAVTVLGCGVETVVNINGINVADVPAPISLSVESDKLGGTVRVGSTWATM
tara:strand:- start:2422 stop:2844 length:423 start_codon:yes stop_codon:yes gene_type:complete